MADILRTYHDVTTLDKGLALSKIKDIMDISGNAEFYSVVKDPYSYIARVGDNNLALSGSDRNFSTYLIPGRYYTFAIPGANSSGALTSGTALAATIELTRLVLKSGKTFEYNTNGYSGTDKTFTGWKNNTNSMAIMYVNSKWQVVFSRQYNTSNNVTSSHVTTTTVSNTWTYRAPMNDIQLLEFKVHYATGTFQSGDDSKIFTWLKRSYTTDDYANVLYVTRNTTQNYSVRVNGLSNAGYLRTFLDNVLNYNHEYGEDSLTVSALNTLWSMGETTSSLSNTFGSGTTGIIEIKDVNSAKYVSGKIDDYVGKDIIIFTNVNLPAATFIKNVLQERGVGTSVSISQHSTQNILDNVSFSSITHPKGTDLVIGDPNNAGYVSFIENVTLNSKNLSGVNKVTTNTITAKGGESEITTLKGSTATYTTVAATNMNVSGSLNVANLGITSIAERTTGTTNGTKGTIDGMYLLVFDTSANSSNNNQPYNMVRRSNTPFDTDVNTGDSGLSNAAKHQFLGIDGAFRTLTPTYLGASDRDHGHGSITNGGAITSSAVAIESDDTIVITDNNDSKKIKRGLSFTKDGTGVKTNKEQYLSKNGTWQGIKDIFFQGELTSAADVDGAKKVGLYKIKIPGDNAGYTFLNEDNSYGIPRVAQYGQDDTKYEAILLVLPSTGDTIAGNVSGTNRIIQVAYTINNPSATAQIFVRSGTEGPGDNKAFAWNKWVAFAHTDHTHALEYAALTQNGTNIIGGLHIFNTRAIDSNILSLNENALNITFTVAQNIAEFALSNSTSTFNWNINSTTLMQLSASGNTRSLSLGSGTSLTVGGSTTLKKLVYLSSASGDTACNKIASNGDTANASVMLLSKASGNLRTISYSDVTGTELYYLSGVTSSIQTQLNSKLPKAGGTMTGTLNLHNSASNLTPGKLDSSTDINSLRNGFWHTYTDSNTTSNITNGPVSSTGFAVIAATNYESGSDIRTSYLALDPLGRIYFKGTRESTPTWHKVAYVTDIPGNATTSASGLMSSTDKSRLDTIYSSLNDDDSNNVVDRLKEVLSVFSQYPEGTTVVDYLGTKLNLSGGTMTGTITSRSIIPSADITYDIGSSTKEYRQLYARAIAARHIDASVPFGGDKALYIGYGSLGGTKVTYFYYSPDTSSRSLKATVDTNGFTINDKLLPNANNSTNIGISDKQFANVYTQNVRAATHQVASGTTVKVTMQYNTNEDCLDFIFS